MGMIKGVTNKNFLQQIPFLTILGRHPLIKICKILRLIDGLINQFILQKKIRKADKKQRFYPDLDKDWEII